MNRNITFVFSERLKTLLADKGLSIEFNPSFTQLDPMVGDLIKLDDTLVVRVVSRLWSLKESQLVITID